MKKENDDLLNFNLAKKILRISKDTTLLKFVEVAKLDIFPTGEKHLSSAYLSKSSLQQALKLKNLPEKFLLTSEVARIFGISESQVVALCHQNDLPYYKINWRRGGKILFIEEEVRAQKIINLSLVRPLDHYAVAWYFEKCQEFITAALESAEGKNLFSERSYQILAGLLLRRNSVDELAQRYGLTPATILSIFDKNFTRLKVMIAESEERLGAARMEIFSLRKKNNELQNHIDKNAWLADIVPKAKAENIPLNLFTIDICERDLSFRTSRCLATKGISNLGELISLSANDLLRIRNFGHKSLDEIIVFLKAKGLTLKNSE